MPRLKDLLAPACATLLLALFTTSAVQATPDDWVKAAFKHAEWPSYISVSNKPGSKLDIGEIKGDVTYEFFVKAKSADGKSSCLLGVQGKNSCNAGLKFCQFNSKRHGITEFGKTDHTFAEPAPEINTDLTHLTFVAEKEANRTTLYVNGIKAGTIDAYVAPRGQVGLGYVYNTQKNTKADNFKGKIEGFAVFKHALSAEQIEARHTAWHQKPAEKDEEKEEDKEKDDKEKNAPRPVPIKR